MRHLMTMERVTLPVIHLILSIHAPSPIANVKSLLRRKHSEATWKTKMNAPFATTLSLQTTTAPTQLLRNTSTTASNLDSQPLQLTQATLLNLLVRFSPTWTRHHNFEKKTSVQSATCRCWESNLMATNPYEKPMSPPASSHSSHPAPPPKQTLFLQHTIIL